MTIRFGTSGWRGILADDFGFDGVRAVSAAVARWAGESGARPRVVVAHDTRFLGDRLADVAARVLTAAGIRPIRPGGPVPTPVASSAVRHLRAAAGIVLTASHNAPEYQGLKVVAPSGGGATDEITRKLEAWTAEVLASGAPPEVEPRGRIVDLRGPYTGPVPGFWTRRWSAAGSWWRFGEAVAIPASVGSRRIRFPSTWVHWRARFAGGRGFGWGSPPMGMRIATA
jgi:hypothetical protein